MKAPGGNPRAADAIDVEVGRRIAARRTGLGLSQTALAHRVGISFQQLQKYEAGLNRVSASRLHRIATAMGIEIGAFFPVPTTGDFTEAYPRADDLMGSAEGRLVAARFPLIADRATRRAVARVIEALSVAA